MNRPLIRLAPGEGVEFPECGVGERLEALAVRVAEALGVQVGEAIVNVVEQHFVLGEPPIGLCLSWDGYFTELRTTQDAKVDLSQVYDRLLASGLFRET